MKNNSFVLSVHLSIRLSVRMEQLGSHLTDFHELWYLNIFWKSVEKIWVPLNSDKNNGYFTWRPVHNYENILLSSSESENCFRHNVEKYGTA
jgi:hypothetical protein